MRNSPHKKSTNSIGNYLGPNVGGGASTGLDVRLEELGLGLRSLRFRFRV